MENASMISSAPRRPRGSSKAAPRLGGGVTAPVVPVPLPVAPTALMKIPRNPCRSRPGGPGSPAGSSAGSR